MPFLRFSDHAVIWIFYISMQWKFTNFVAENDKLIMSLRTLFCITFWLHLDIHLHIVLKKYVQDIFDILTHDKMRLLSLYMISQFCDVRCAVYRWTPKLIPTTLHVGNQRHDQWRTSLLAEIFVVVTLKHVLFFIFVVPCIMLYNCEISPTRCNNCVLFFAMALLYMFRETNSPIIRSTYAVYGQR